MICTKCGKGELQELTGTEMLICPLCSCKLISPNAHQYSPELQSRGWSDDHMVGFAKFVYCYIEGWDGDYSDEAIGFLLKEFLDKMDQKLKPKLNQP